MTVDRKVLERIQKMLEKARSLQELGQHAEAESFMVGVQKTLAAYKLSMSDVEFRAMQAEDPIRMSDFDPEAIGLKRSKVRILWQEALACAVARAHGCDVVTQRGNRWWLVGRRQDRQVAELVLAMLLRTATERSEREYVTFFYQCHREGRVEDARGFKANWLNAFVVRIIARYRDEQAAHEAEVKAAGQGTALIRLSQEKALIQAFIKNDLGATEQGQLQGRRGATDAGREEGDQAGRQATIRQTGLGAGEPAKNQLGQPARQLSAGT